MKRDKVNYKDFIRQISKDTGYAQKDISAVLESAENLIDNNLNNGIETTALKGMVVYRASYKGEVNYARARFGKSFKLNPPIS